MQREALVGTGTSLRTEVLELNSPLLTLSHVACHIVREGVDGLKVPIKGHPVTTMEVSVKWENKGNTQKYVSNEKMHEYACTNNF